MIWTDCIIKLCVLSLKMRQDIERIKGVSLDHIDMRLGKTSSTLINLEEIFNKKFERIDKIVNQTNHAKIDLATVKNNQCLKEDLKHILSSINQFKQYIKESQINSTLPKLKKQIQLIIKQIIKYYTSQLSAKDTIILNLQSKLKQYTTKISQLQQQVGIKLRIENKFCQTMPNTKPIPSNSQNKYTSLSGRKQQPMKEFISTELHKFSNHSDFLEAKSEMLISKINQRKNSSMNLMDISEEFKARENTFLKVSSTHRENHKRQDSVPSLPKPLRKNSQQCIFYPEPFMENDKERQCAKIKAKTRRASVQEVEPPVPSNRTKPSNVELFKGKKSLLMSTDTRGPELFKLLTKNR